jgi:acyl-CoA thioesterase I
MRFSRLAGSVIMLMLVLACSNDKQSTKQAETGNKAAGPATKKKTIVFFGNSLTAGYGLTTSEAFPALIQQTIDSLQLPYTVVNAGVSGETTAGGNSRIDWILKQPLDVFVLELGANDGLRGIPVSETRKNFQSIINKVRTKYPEAKLLLTGMQIPPNMGQQFSREFRDVYPALAKQNNISLVPFLLEGVGGEVKLNQQDGIHPTIEGHRILAKNVWKHLQSLL